MACVHLFGTNISQILESVQTSQPPNLFHTDFSYGSCFVSKQLSKTWLPKEMASSIVMHYNLILKLN